MIDIKPRLNTLVAAAESPAIVKFPSFMSPSSLKAFEGQPNTFMLERMVENPKPRDPQSLAAASGSAFDYFIKTFLIEELKMDRDALRARIFKALFSPEDRERYKDAPIEQILWETNIEPQNRKDAQKIGVRLFATYANILRNNAEHFGFVDVELSRIFEVGGVPIYGKQDAVIRMPIAAVDGSDVLCPHDWKVSGAASDSGQSLKQRYKMSWAEDGYFLGPHEKYRKDILMTEIDKDWALQCCIYGWMMGKPLGKPFLGVIDMLAVRPSGVKVGRYEGIIDGEFQLNVVRRLQTAWNEINSLKIWNRVGINRPMMEILASQETWW